MLCLLFSLIVRCLGPVADSQGETARVACLCDHECMWMGPIFHKRVFFCDCKADARDAAAIALVGFTPTASQGA